MSDKAPLVEKWGEKVDFLPNTPVLLKYGSIFSQLWLLYYRVLKYSATSGTSHSIPFLCAISFIPAAL